MKARDIVESWRWRSPEEIIEALLRASSRTIGLVFTTPRPQRVSDKYSAYWTAVRRRRLKRLMTSNRA